MSARNVHQLALITGTSSGIGLELAKTLASRERCDLILVARTKEKLDQLAHELEKKYSIRCHAIAMDLGQHGSARNLYDQVKKMGLSPDILINNAGFGDVGAFVHAKDAKIENMMTLNMETLTLLTRYFAADMVEQRKGRILNVASIAAFQPGPYMAVYYATKAYVLSFTEALAVELKKSGVTITALCPGPVLTGFQSGANMAEDAGMLKTPAVLPAAKVAEIGYAAMKDGSTVAIAGTINRLMTFSTRLAPRSITAKIAGRLNRSHKHKSEKVL